MSFLVNKAGDLIEGIYANKAAAVAVIATAGASSLWIGKKHVLELCTNPYKVVEYIQNTCTLSTLQTQSTRLINFIYHNKPATFLVALSNIWLGRITAHVIQNSYPAEYIRSLSDNKLKKILEASYWCYSFLFPAQTTRRRLLTVILVENGLFALQISIGHLFFTQAVPPEISFRRRMVAAVCEAILISVVIDTTKKIVGSFFIAPLAGYIKPIA